MHNTKPNDMKTGEQIADAVAMTIHQIRQHETVTDETIAFYCALNGTDEAYIRKVATESIYWKTKRQL